MVGANAVGRATLDYLINLQEQSEIDHFVVNRVNLNRRPMIRRMIEFVNTEFIWWFDDDLHQ